MKNNPRLERFCALASAYGAERSHWPEYERPLFDEYALVPESQLVLAAAQQVDHFLDSWQPITRENTVAMGILAGLPAQHPRSSVNMRSPWLPAIAMMFCALLGFSNGYFAFDFSDMAGHTIPIASGLSDEE